MKFFIVIIAILAVFASVSAFIIPESINAGFGNQMVRLEDVDTDGGIYASPTDMRIRHRRLICELFSFSSKISTPNHHACAMRCFDKGQGGGYCEGSMCICRNGKWKTW